MGIVNRDHLGWLLCDGRTLSVQRYYQLWEVIGYSFTGNTIPSTLFQLPNPAGTVPGIVGTGRDVENPTSTFTFELGKQYGEYQHKLTIPEMPSHNHEGFTSTMSTGITILDNLTGITDNGHTHSYTAAGGDNTYVANPGNTKTGRVEGATTGTGYANINDPQHNHSYMDPHHYHYFSTSYTGGDRPHNNVQPTLAIGNMFIYSGFGRNSSNVTDPNLWPYAIGTNLL